MKIRNIILGSAVASIIIILFIITLSGVYRDQRRRGKDEGETVYSSGYVSDGGEDLPLESDMTGDVGLIDEEALEIDSFIIGEAQGKSKADMADFILGYLGYIPFADGGRHYGSGYFKAPDGVDNRIQDPVGMDSLGYVIWVYRNVFGNCIPEFDDPDSWASLWIQVDHMDLEIGDIGYYEDSVNGKKHFGIYVGKEQGIPIFAHCAGLATPRYPCGNDRLSFLKSYSLAHYMGNAPVDFQQFYRPHVNWETEEAEFK